VSSRPVSVDQVKDALRSAGLPVYQGGALGAEVYGFLITCFGFTSKNGIAVRDYRNRNGHPRSVSDAEKALSGSFVVERLGVALWVKAHG
jgi:hypothetical protein